jgi:hypothetical protein
VAVTMERQRVYTQPRCDDIMHTPVPGDDKRRYRRGAQMLKLPLAAFVRQAVEHELERLGLGRETQHV